MGNCVLCGIEISGDKEYCKSCLQRRRSIKHYLKWLNDIINEMSSIEKKKDDKKDGVVIAS